MNQRTAPLVLGAIVAAAAGCSAPPPTPAPLSDNSPSSAATSVELPPPESRGPQVTVEGDATWLTGKPGCISLITAAGQRFQLTGTVVVDSEHRARVGEQPRAQRV